MTRLESIEYGSADIRGIVNELRILAESGCYEVCEVLAEVLTLSDEMRDPAGAYVWYYVSLKTEGYSVELKNVTPDNETYYGDTDDFRNEAMVSDLIDELGQSRLAKLDAMAEEWMAAHPRVELDLGNEGVE